MVGTPWTASIVAALACAAAQYTTVVPPVAGSAAHARHRHHHHLDGQPLLALITVLTRVVSMLACTQTNAILIVRHTLGVGTIHSKVSPATALFMITLVTMVFCTLFVMDTDAWTAQS